MAPRKGCWSSINFLWKDIDESKKGLSWIEMGIDFETATRVMLTGSAVTRATANGKQTASESKGEDTVTQRAHNFAEGVCRKDVGREPSRKQHRFPHSCHSDGGQWQAFHQGQM